MRTITPDPSELMLASTPSYYPAADEVDVFERATRAKLPVLLKGPTGCGKSRFVQHMAARMGRPLITVACHEDLSAADLVGRFLLLGEETVWCDGPLTAGARLGAMVYLDEVVEARNDSLVVIHPLIDDRRVLPIDRLGQTLEVHPDFILVVSYNPGYQSILKDLKASTRQRFVALEFSYPEREHEAQIVSHETGLPQEQALQLVRLAERLRMLREQGLSEGASTRLLVHTARLMQGGMQASRACEVAMVRPLSDDLDLQGAMLELVRDFF